MSVYQPFTIYVLTEGGKTSFNLVGIPDQMIRGLSNALLSELFIRSSKTSFRDEREKMELKINPKNLTLFQSKK